VTNVGIVPAQLWRIMIDYKTLNIATNPWCDVGKISGAQYDGLHGASPVAKLSSGAQLKKTVCVSSCAHFCTPNAPASYNQDFPFQFLPSYIIKVGNLEEKSRKSLYKSEVVGGTTMHVGYVN